MDRAALLKEMKESVGHKDPVVFFEKMVDVFSLLFNENDSLKNELALVKRNSALAIQWEPRVAADMLVKQIEVLRQDKETYFNELTALKKAYADDRVTQDYHSFCEFWLTTLGYHPFLDYNE